jgi:2,4'-dihydroxyacetophenone dioxygenase
MNPIPNSPFTRPEMFLPDVMVEDNKWYPLGKTGMVRPLMVDVSNGGWVSILKARGSGTIQRHRHASPVTALFHVMGPLVYVDEAGNPTDHDDVSLRLDHYTKHCKEVGLGEDFGRSMIR